MKKITYSILVFIISVQLIQSQTCIPIPTDFGEKIAKHFIAQSKASELPYASIMEADSWDSLLQENVNNGIDFSTLKYETTYFSGNESHKEYDLIIILKTDKEPLELEFTARVVDNKWSLINSAYAYVLDASETPLPKTAKYTVKTITSTTCLDNPNLFIKKVIASLENSISPNEMPFLMDESDYKKIILPDFLSHLDKILLKDNLRDKDREEVLAMKKELNINPTKVYTEEILKPISRITTYLKGVNFSTSKIQKTHYYFQNHNYQMLKDGTITIEVHVEFLIDKSTEAILFICHWIDNQWVLSRIQGSTYGIEEVVSE